MRVARVPSVLFAVATAALPVLPQSPPPGPIDPALFESLPWREVGPYRGGRSSAVAGIQDQPRVYYFGATGGGVWKTGDGGRSWKNVSDEFFGGSVGAVAVAPSDPNVVYVGTGETTVRGNVSHGDGMWKSTDAGRTWQHIGLPESRHIGRVRVHPQDPDVVYAAVLGHLFGSNPARGVFRSRDGGASWQRILHVNDDTGAVDLEMDPTNPRILYACMWRVRRTPWGLDSGGEGSGMWKSVDGGDHWQEIGGNQGLPAGVRGISGIAVSPSNPDNVYAIVEAAEGGVFRSRDAGETWTRTNSDRSLRQRAWYYSRIYADPANEESVYVVNVAFHRSLDGGKSFSTIRTPHGDNHDLWIARDDPRRMIESNDGGANVSFDGGVTWSPQDNQPTAQMYRLSTDNSFPYRILGAQQDNSAIRIRSRGFAGGAVGVRDWEPTAGGESGHIVAKPDDDDLVYGGSYGGYLTWLNHRTGERRSVNVWPDNPMGWGAAGLRYRFQWNFPLFFSPHDPDTLYCAANVLFKSVDGGDSWDPISPDLTRDDKDKQGPSGGPITKDNTGVEYYCTVFAALESPLEPGVLWAGSDDGLVHLSRNAGRDWLDVTPAGLPEWAQINSIEAHPTEAGGVYLAATAYKLDDFRPYLFKTTDYGQSWQKIVSGIADDHFTRVIRADPDRAGLLYAGTERGVYVSFDDGGHWQPLQGKLPIVPITDLAVKHQDLVAATQGRGFWILDDLSVLHQLEPDTAGRVAQLYAPRATVRTAPGGAVLRYFLPRDLEDGETLALEIKDDAGEVIRSFERVAAPGSEQDPHDGHDGVPDPRVMPAEKGLNLVSWDLRYPGAKGFADMILWSGRGRGPRALPGRYHAVLDVAGVQSTVSLEVSADPRSTAAPGDRVAQFNFLIETRDKLSETHRAIADIRALRADLAALRERAGERDGGAEVIAASKAIDEQITAIEEALYQTKNKSRQDPLNFPIRWNDKLAGLMSSVAMGEFGPTRQARQVRDELVAAIDEQLNAWREIRQHAVAELNELAHRSGVPAIK